MEKMPEQMPPTGLTLEKVKQFLKDNYLAYSIKKQSGMILGVYEWDVKCKEKIDENRSEKRNYRLYTKGQDNKSEASWEKNQCPAFFNHPTLTPKPTFANKLEAYIKTQVDDGKIKFGFIVQLNESQKKALCNAIMPDKSDKSILVTESAEEVFSFEVLQ